MTTHRRTGILKPAAPTREPHKYHLVFALSDWHLDEKVQLAAADGSGMVNRFSPAIAEERVTCLIRSSVAVYNMYAERGGERPPLTIWLGGDFATLAIHEESRSITSMPPRKALVFAREQISRYLDQVVEGCNPSRLDVACSVGNHERTTQKPSVTIPSEFSYAPQLYDHLAERHTPGWRKAGILGVWLPPPDEGPVSYLPLSFGRLARFCHGDARGLKYQGGIGGLTVPLTKWTSRQNTEPGAAGAVTFVGHWHTFGWHESARAISNGSLIGYNGFARSIGVSFEPPCQAAAVFSPKLTTGPIAVHRLTCG